MQSLLTRLFDITLLRGSPADLPRSWVVFYLCLSLWLLSLMSSLVLLTEFSADDAAISLQVAVAGWLLYWGLLIASRRGARAIQTMAAVMGCGALVSFAMLVVQVLLAPFLGNGIATLIAILVLVWSVPVKGHIVAHALGWHWYGGIAFAMLVFVLQYALTLSFNPQT